MSARSARPAFRGQFCARALVGARFSGLTGRGLACQVGRVHGTEDHADAAANLEARDRARQVGPSAGIVDGFEGR